MVATPRVCLFVRMKGSTFSFFSRASKAFHDQHPFYKVLIVSTAATVSGGGAWVICDYRESGAAAYRDPSVPRKKVVVLGTGWAGTSFLKNLNSSSYEVQVVSPRNYFAFTPLLPSVTCGTVEARSIVEPIRNIVKKKPSKVQFREAECYKVDPVNKKVYCKSSQQLDGHGHGQEEFSVDYDYLVVAMGARANTFNTPGVVENCHFLKEIEDAQRIRRTVIDCFERANLPNMTDEQRRQILHFVVVGGGPTGVEFAAELHDFVKQDLSDLYPSLDGLASITLLEAADHILNMFDKRITDFAEDKFKRDGIDLKTGSMVTKVTEKEIFTKERATGEMKSTPYGMVVWSTGIGTRPVVLEFMKQIGQTNRRAIATDEWLRVEGSNCIYALGDCATINERKVMEDVADIFNKADKDKRGKLNLQDFKAVVKDICERYPHVELYMKKKQFRNLVELLKNTSTTQGNGKNIEIDIEQFKAALSAVDSQMKNLPATAQVAAQQGAYLVNCFNRMEKCEQNPEGPSRIRGTGRHRFQPFRYKHFGQFAPLGGEQAAAQLPGDWVSIGHSSQWLWYSVYASKLVSWRTRMLVVSDWTRRFIFGRDSSRI
ncbi:External alternative NAD(P)H-ubiquinone oxidoreductase B2, mitochondrial [Dionaea muscipula]